MNLISCEELKRKMDLKEDFKLVNALEESKFRAMHIPGSLNIYMKEDIQTMLAIDDEIVVYCTDEACTKSILLYQLLETMGYKKLWRFAGGLRKWQEDGYALVGEMVS